VIKPNIEPVTVRILNEPDGLCRVRWASQVRHVDGLQQPRLRRVSVEVELQYGVVTEDDQSNTTDSWTASDAVDVQRLNDHAYELRHELEVVKPHAVGRVQCEHHIGAVRASYARRHLSEQKLLRREN